MREPALRPDRERGAGRPGRDERAPDPSAEVDGRSGCLPVAETREPLDDRPGSTLVAVDPLWLTRQSLQSSLICRYPTRH